MAGEGLAPVQCFHGAQTDPHYGGLNTDSVRKAVDEGASVVWFPVISSAHSIHRVGAPRPTARRRWRFSNWRARHCANHSR